MVGLRRQSALKKATNDSTASTPSWAYDASTNVDLSTSAEEKDPGKDSLPQIER